MEAESTPPAIDLKPSLKKLIVIFGLFHGVSMLLAIFPDSWIEGIRIKRMKIGQILTPILAPYRQVTSPQEWGMFHTIPTMQGNEITVGLADVNGNVETYGPLLPGLRSYRMHSKIRNYYLLNRVTDPSNRYYDGYVEGLREALVGEGAETTDTFSVHLESDYIRLLKLIDKDGKMTLRKSEVRGPFTIGE